MKNLFGDGIDRDEIVAEVVRDAEAARKADEMRRQFEELLQAATATSDKGMESFGAVVRVALIAALALFALLAVVVIARVARAERNASRADRNASKAQQAVAEIASVEDDILFEQYRPVAAMHATRGSLLPDAIAIEAMAVSDALRRPEVSYTLESMIEVVGEQVQQQVQQEVQQVQQVQRRGSRIPRAVDASHGVVASQHLLHVRSAAAYRTPSALRKTFPYGGRHNPVFAAVP